MNIPNRLNDPLIDTLNQILMAGVFPDSLPEDILADASAVNLLRHIHQLQLFTLALASGDLEPELKLKGRSAGALKTLQANLRHLTWQTQRIAAGDLNQRVEFMGEFASAFNTMVTRLKQSRDDLEQRAFELAEQRRQAVQLMHDAQTARLETEKAHKLLQQQMAEIQVLQEQLREQAIRDPLTGCFNRRYLEESVQREFSRAEHEQNKVSLVMIDIDLFKNVNDTYGHDTGDRVLAELGKLMNQITRQEDIVCRYGGEEFLIVFPNTSLETAFLKIEDLRKQFAQLNIVYQQICIQCTFSAGVAFFPAHGKNAEEVLRSADLALYAAKANGRNRTVCAG